MSKIKRPER